MPGSSPVAQMMRNRNVVRPPTSQVVTSAPASSSVGAATSPASVSIWPPIKPAPTGTKCRGDCGQVHPPREHRQQEAEEERRQHLILHDDRVHPAGMNNRLRHPIRANWRHQPHRPPHHRQEQVARTDEEQQPMRRRCQHARQTSRCDRRCDFTHASALRCAGSRLPAPAARFGATHSRATRTTRAQRADAEDRVARHAHPHQRLHERLLHELGRARVPEAVLDRPHAAAACRAAAATGAPSAPGRC